MITKICGIVLIVGCVAIVAGVILSRIIARKKGKPSCDCGCADCASCKLCKSAKEKSEKN